MASRVGRWALAVAGVGVAVASTLFLVRVQTSAPLRLHALAATTTAEVVRDPHRPPWYRMSLLHDSVTLVDDPAPADHVPASDAVAGLVVDADTGRILWERNEHARMAPASTLKLLTALVSLVNFRPDKLVTVTTDSVNLQWDESRMFLHPGDRLTVQELLSGLLTVSANDAANTLANDTVGAERFVGAMNAQALALGLRDTHAVTPVGLDDPGNYSSAYDLASLAIVDERHFPLFGWIVAQHSITLPASALHPMFVLNNINLLLQMYPAATGIKTGYTGNAGQCEIGMAERNGHHLIDVLLNGNYVYGTSMRLLDWGFTQEGLPTQLPPSPSPSPSPTPHR